MRQITHGRVFDTLQQGVKSVFNRIHSTVVK